MKPRPKTLQDCGAILLDVGGTLKIGREAVPSAPEFVRALKRKGTPYFILSNTTNVSAETLAKQLNSLGFRLAEDQVVTANTTAISYLKKHDLTTVYVIGTNEQRSEYERHGISVTHEKAQAVLVSLDYELSYADLTVADVLLRRGASFIATNTDTHTVTPEGLLPDVGGTIGFLTATTGLTPVVTGKPSQLMLDHIRDLVDLPTNQMAIIGDNLDIDMKMAYDNGMVSVLVLSGKTTREDLISSEYQPDYIVESVENLIPLFS